MDNERDFIALLYFITFILFVFWYYQRTYCVTKPETSNHLNEIELDNGSHLTRINSDQQRYSEVPLNILNSLEYENILYNPLQEQPRQQYITAQTSINNISTTRATIIPFSSSLNYVELNSSNVGSFSRSPLDDPPPSYEECVVSYRP
ncbi:uncharacterized protein LOC100572519 [Acyrthosiphon pisum]|uniref:Uncharacterized protein n=1 Tax=Acyrthosiphon pisum TaxID=7029 RepID=A0A8R2ABX8_ACYPI|nr:uncharacterized protein LOC100572519 [Acyrthosiphon pisum]|eukprot:XP_003244277.1 PREDICTED: uncharacterized protein LOC100572519 [Acyrthosiphon pisum]